MSDLEDVFGEDFAQHVQQRTAERRQERNRLTDEQMVKVAHLAINEGKFEEGDPQFTFTTDNGITHNIMLVQVPEPDNGEVWDHLSEPWEGAAQLPLSYLGQWYWSTFPEKKDVAKLEQGDHAIVAGSIDENEGDNGEVYYNIYPVRGVLTLEEAREYAQKSPEDIDFEEEDEPDEDFADEEEDDTSDFAESDESDDEEETGGGLAFDSDSGGESGGGLDGLMDDTSSDESDKEEEEEELSDEVPYSEIAAQVEELAEGQNPEEEPQVYEIEEGSDHHKRLATVVANNLELSDQEAVADVVIDVIEEHREDDEEDDNETEMLF